MFTQDEITEQVKAIAKKETVPVIRLSIDEICKRLEKDGKQPSKAMVWKALVAIGAVADKKKFIYRHNGGKE